MLDIAGVLSLLNLLGLGGVAYFIYYVLKGLRERIQSLTHLVEEQQKTLETVRVRAAELDQLRKDYKQALDDFQDLGRKLEERRNVVIKELETANKQKDDELARLKTLELQEIELKKASLERMPQLEERLTTTIEELQRQIRIVSSGTSERWAGGTSFAAPRLVRWLSREYGGAGHQTLHRAHLLRLLLAFDDAQLTLFDPDTLQAANTDRTINSSAADEAEQLNDPKTS